MCFIIDPKQPDFKIAENDIDCYKLSWEDRENVVSDIFRPFHREYFTYTLNKKTKDEIVCPSFFGSDSINEGYHSFKDESKLIGTFGITPRATGKFIIPKGTKYYENDYEYVSETLIFKGYIK